jgi:hypothetical protein
MIFPKARLSFLPAKSNTTALQLRYKSDKISDLYLINNRYISLFYRIVDEQAFYKTSTKNTKKWQDLKRMAI